VLRELEVGAALGVGLEPRAVGLVVGEARERDEAVGDVVRAFVRQEVAEQFAAAARNDGEPAPRIGGEGLALERVDLVADAAGDGHGGGLRVAMPSR
jgi:hypothetical protein